MIYTDGRVILSDKSNDELRVWVSEHFTSPYIVIIRSYYRIDYIEIHKCRAKKAFQAVGVTLVSPSLLTDIMDERIRCANPTAFTEWHLPRLPTGGD